MKSQNQLGGIDNAERIEKSLRSIHGVTTISSKSLDEKDAMQFSMKYSDSVQSEEILTVAKELFAPKNVDVRIGNPGNGGRIVLFVGTISFDADHYPPLSSF